MMLYAIGALHAYGYIYNIETVRMTIVQPRLENISTYESSREELEAWGESIRETAKMAYEGKGEQKAGDWCRFCRAKPVCRACAEEALALAREEFLDLEDGAFSDGGTSSTDSSSHTLIKPSISSVTCEGGEGDGSLVDTGSLVEKSSPVEMDGAEETDITAPYEADRTTPVFRQPGLVSFSELELILPTLNRISSWIESVFAFVTTEAIQHGVPVRGYKVVEGRSKRIFSDTNAVVKTAIENGYTDLYKQQLISLTEFEKMMGKKRFAELLGSYVVKPPGKLALVPESDPRPPVELDDTADREFTVLQGGMTKESFILDSRSQTHAV